ncbi:hypothetical protein [uncultured Microbacterium sp.]|uniref:hypothetical protein n=1 Tax=uncultured Microbacterium sp. TaxID=191216 RepID=UPI002615159C|nr:hypothetical protein [uncultured Microbacterium sp.]
MTVNTNPTRKRPKSEITRELFLYSGNQCAFPGCSKPLLNKKGSYVAQIAHIEGVGKSSARHNQKLSDEDLRAVANLMLMCPNHHIEVDDKKRLAEFTVEALRAMKEKHEAKFRDAISQMSEEIGDLTDAEPTYPTSLHAFGIKPDDDFHDEELAAVRSAIDRLAKLPPSARQILVVAIGQSKPGGGWGQVLEASAIAVEKIVTNIDREEYRQLLGVLQERNFLDWDDNDGHSVLQIKGTAKDGSSELNLLLELEAAFRGNSVALRRTVVELDFSVLDQAPEKVLD